MTEKMDLIIIILLFLSLLCACPVLSVSWVGAKSNKERKEGRKEGRWRQPTLFFAARTTAVGRVSTRLDSSV